MTKSEALSHVVETFIEAAKRRTLTVVFPEGRDERVVAAARRLRDERIAEPIVLGKARQIEHAANEANVRLDGIRTVDPVTSGSLEAYATAYVRRRSVPVTAARRIVAKPTFHAGMMVACGEADAMVAGVASSTFTVIQAATLTVGHGPGIETASSCFLMIIPEFQGEANKRFIFADCALNVSPTPSELADIAIASEASARKLLEEPPRVALLSFSTHGSSVHADAKKVTEALAMIRQRAPHLTVDGELQADSAIVPRVAAKKVKSSSQVAGLANVLIFPDLNAGNIAYKLTQYLAGARAIGPLLQGFSKPIADLSRGASVEDIVAVTAICLARAERRD